MFKAFFFFTSVSQHQYLLWHLVQSSISTIEQITLTTRKNCTVLYNFLTARLYFINWMFHAYLLLFFLHFPHIPSEDINQDPFFQMDHIYKIYPTPTAILIYPPPYLMSMHRAPIDQLFCDTMPPTAHLLFHVLVHICKWYVDLCLPPSLLMYLSTTHRTKFSHLIDQSDWVNQMFG